MSERTLNRLYKLLFLGEESPVPIVITREKGCWSAKVADITFNGKTPAEALRNALDAKETWPGAARERGPAQDKNKVIVYVPSLNILITTEVQTALEELKEGVETAVWLRKEYRKLKKGVFL